ncbi:hypothetical protein V1J52_11055 [Streptomyces sp. TRM 70351]|uniref:hypothetical protein n=1 Tax=Streptomyces sp. TRM 70351 TaxID=3116552 RepID=UPI002E7BDF7C|nr:hypothetical protein [Streptomyces sp. TRM 70351]MEE1928727.1 hypothetical protein [Streptomyces sp. TRM 70351]
MRLLLGAAMITMGMTILVFLGRLVRASVAGQREIFGASGRISEIYGRIIFSGVGSGLAILGILILAGRVDL